MNKPIKTGDTVYVTSFWKKQGIFMYRLGMVHGEYAKIQGDLLQLGKQFFLTRGEAHQDLLRRHQISTKQATNQYHKHIAEIDRVLKTEEECARQEGRDQREARRLELAARADEKLLRPAE